jgi:cellulose synthase/poly-beta-1,6-N-acetylglucosamine synthase-like glycosyltransferase
MDAVCWTTAPPTYKKYFAQQLRWRRSNLVDILGGISHAARLHPVVGMHYLCSGALLICYPVVVLQKLANGTFWELAAFHLMVLAALGTVYAFHARRLPREMRVHPLSFLSMAVVMPVTYIVCTTLAMFTLDSSSWETRGHGRVVEAMATASSTEAPFRWVEDADGVRAHVSAALADFDSASSLDAAYPTDRPASRVQA